MASTTTVLEEVLPHWEWETPDGGTGLWADTGIDALPSTGARCAGSWTRCGCQQARQDHQVPVRPQRGAHQAQDAS